MTAHETLLSEIARKFRFFVDGLSDFNVLGGEIPRIQSDEDAIRSDWQAVGKDIRDAMDSEKSR